MIQQKVRENNTCFNAHFQYNQSKTTILNRMWPLKSLPMLRVESSVRVELAYMYKFQPGSVVMFWSYYFKNS